MGGIPVVASLELFRDIDPFLSVSDLLVGKPIRVAKNGPLTLAQVSLSPD